MIYVKGVEEVQNDWYPSRPTIAIRCLSSKYCLQRLDEMGHVVPRYDFLRAHNDFLEVLELIFDDLDDKVSTSLRFNWTDGEIADNLKDIRKNRQNVEYILFEDFHAVAIKRFVERHMGSFKDMMVHCNSAVGRSPAVAVPFSEKHGWEIDSNPARFYPKMNERVYQIMKEVLG